MTVSTWFQANPADIAVAAATVLTKMQAAGPPKIDSTPKNSAWLARNLGRAFVGTIDEKLKAKAGNDWIRMSLANAGIDFSHPEVQGGLTDLQTANVIDAATAKTLKELGVKPQTAWQALCGDEPLPTTAQITAGQTAATTAKWLAKTLNEVVNPAVAAGQTVAQVKALIASAN